jgi:hypothetical protein
VPFSTAIATNITEVPAGGTYAGLTFLDQADNFIKA